jgi:signal transduction histidine kinase
VFYENSVFYKQLKYYPLILIIIVSIFLLIAYFAFSWSRKAEQNQVWVGMSKETAHQLGTPISSILAWIELLKLKEVDNKLVEDIEKDVRRLETITERFSKIGSAPVLEKENLNKILANAVNYIKKRTTDKVSFVFYFDENSELLVPINTALFEWVVENICKNAIDAMEGAGQLEISIKDNMQIVYIDIKDTGKGIPKSKYKTIFQPGYTTKKRGWGLGLSLSKRIIEQYHLGKIFVKSSELNKGTTFRIVLKK